MTSYIRSTISTVRTHKKKTAFLCVCAAFGARYGQNKLRDADIRRFYCSLAQKYGNETISPLAKPRRVTVLLNRWAKDSKARSLFEQNALPLLNLAGLEVNVIRAESEEQLQNIASALDKSEADAVYVVGGDGTISKSLAGLYANGSGPRLPVGAYPGGRNNYSLRSLWSGCYQIPEVRWACESAMALIRDVKRKYNVIKVQMDDAEQTAPFYCFSHISWGSFAHVEDIKWKYWYWGGLRHRFAYLWNALKSRPEALWADVEYELPCSGCNRCRPKTSGVNSNSNTNNNSNWRWYHLLIGSPASKTAKGLQEEDFSNIVNANCGQTDKISVKTTDLLIENVPGEDKLTLSLGPSELNRSGFISDGWGRTREEKGIRSPFMFFYQMQIDARKLDITPTDISEKMEKITIDGEVCGVSGKFQVQLLPEKVDLFVSPDKFIESDM